jgi:hypothetical protein
LKLEWTQFRTPAYLSRFMLLLGVALAVWTAVGAAVVYHDETTQFAHRTKGARLSLARIGARWLWKIRRSAHLGVEYARSYLPPPRLRLFEWLSPSWPSNPVSAEAAQMEP